MALQRFCPKQQLVTVKSDKPTDTNTIDDPQKIVPVTSTVKGIRKNFKQSFPPYSVIHIKLKPGNCFVDDDRKKK